MVVLFIALACCFTAWGVAADMTTPMVAGFKRIFQMSTFEASLVQLAYFGAYFLLALPAAFINQRFGYKAGMLTGLLLAALGAFFFTRRARSWPMGRSSPPCSRWRQAARCWKRRPTRSLCRSARKPRRRAGEPRPGVQSGGHEHRRAAGRDADPAPPRRPGRRLVAEPGPAAHDPGG